MKDHIFLCFLMFSLIQKTEKYRNYDFLIDFPTYVLVTSIVFNLIFLCELLRFFKREACLRFFIWVLAFILCQKTGNFLYLFTTSICTFHKMKTRTSIKILRHASLHLDLINMHFKFGMVMCNSN